MLRFKYEQGHIMDLDTQEKLSTMEQVADKLNELDTLVDFQTDIEPFETDYDSLD